MKKTVSFIISAVIAAAAAVPAVTASAVNVNSPVVQNLVGDINSDGSLAISDAVLLSGYLLGSEQFTEKQYKAADLNTDGTVDTFDLVVMRERVIADIRADVQQTITCVRTRASLKCWLRSRPTMPPTRKAKISRSQNSAYCNNVNCSK